MTGDQPDHAADTTERMNPAYYLSNRSDAFIYACHLATYDFALRYVKGQRVLDFGCGTGYGTHRIAPACDGITGVDISGDAIEEATRRFAAPGLGFERIEPVERCPLRFDDAAFDVVLSFQVFEHLVDPDAYLREVRRVLVPGGRFVCVTPERGPRLFRGQRPWNRFHVREYSQDEMRTWLERHFTDVEVRGMSARADLRDMEMARTRKLRLATYPVTFPGVPEKVRVGGLAAIKRFGGRRPAVDSELAPAALSDWGFDEQDVTVFTDDVPSLNVVGVATSPASPV